MLHLFLHTVCNTHAWQKPFFIVAICLFQMFVSTGVDAQVAVETGGGLSSSVVNNDLNMVGYSISNLTFMGNALQIGGFQEAGFDFGLDQGMVLGTNHVGYLDPVQEISSVVAQTQYSPTYFLNPPPFPAVPAELTDPVESWIAELTACTNPFPLMPYISNPVVLSFDLIAMGDSLVFDLVFASAEYNLAGEDRNELFACFISGPGIVGPYASPAGFSGGAKNLAYVNGPSGSVPVSKNTIPPVSGPADYPGGPPTVAPFIPLTSESVLNIGYSQPLRCGTEVQCGETYHVEMVLMSFMENQNPSYVLVRCDGEDDEAVLADWAINGIPDESGVLFEGCAEGTLTFFRPEASPLDEELTVSVSYGGSATNGVDIGPLQNTLIFASGEDEVAWAGITADLDGVVEGTEELIITLDNPQACDGNGGINSFVIEIADGPDPVYVEMPEVVVCSGGSAVVHPVVTGGFGNYTFEWCDGSQLDSLLIDNVDNYFGCVLTVGDTCGLPVSNWPVNLLNFTMPDITAGDDVIVCTDSYLLGGEILDLPVPECSEDAGPQTFCYGDNLYTTITHCPDDPGDGTFMTLSFMSGAVYSSHSIWIYDGDNVNSEPIAGPVNDITGAVFEAGNATGCLTIYIESDGANTCTSGTVPPISYTVDCNNNSGYSVEWSPSLWLADSTSLNSEVNVEEEVALELNVALVGSPFCEVTDDVVVQPSFILDATKSNPTCFDPNGFIDVTIEPFAGVGPWTIELWEAGMLQSSIVTPLTSWQFSGLFAGDFEVIVSDENCIRSQSLMLESQPETTLELSSDTTICIGGSADLVAVSSLPGLEWHWSNGVTDSIQTVSPNTSEVYEVYASLIPGCNTDVLFVTVGVLDSLSFEMPSFLEVCLGDSAWVEASAFSGGIEPYTLQWSSNAFGVDYEQGVPAQYLSPSQPTVYCLTMDDACETPSVQSCVDVFVPEDVDPSFEASVISGCFPLQVEFTGLAANPNTIASANWEFGDGTSSTDVDSTSHTYGELGFYSVSYSILTEYGCAFEYAEDSLIRVGPWPIAEFAADPWEQTLPGNRVEFINYSLGAVEYQWDFAGLETSSDFQPEFYFPEQGGEYPVELIATNEWGCSDSVAYYIWLIDDFALYIPNAFSPDNDGQNDAWQIIGQDVDPSHFHARVWDRWGQLVFESRDLEEVWIGGFQGGMHYVQAETYVYVIEARSLSTAAEHTVKGYVTVLR